MDETQLSSWRPRRPSAGLKRRIFGFSRGSSAAAKWLVGTLAPTTACLALTLLMLNSGNGIIRPKPLATFVLGNQGAAAYASEDAQVAQNHLAGVTFEWTNHTGLQSSIRFAPTTNLSN